MGMDPAGSTHQRLSLWQILFATYNEATDMKRFLVALETGLNEARAQHFSSSMASTGFDVTYIEPENLQEEVLEKIMVQSPECMILTSGSLVSSALKASVRSGHSGTLVIINPIWQDDLKPLLSSVEARVIIFTDGPDLSSIRMQAMKYHDRISGSRIHYLKPGPMKALLEHPERLIKALEDAIDAR